MRQEMGISRRKLAKLGPFSVRTIERHESDSNTHELSRLAQVRLEQILKEHRTTAQRERTPGLAARVGAGAPGKAKGETNGNGNGSGPRRRSHVPADPSATVSIPAPPSAISQSVIRPFGRAPMGDEEG